MQYTTTGQWSLFPILTFQCFSSNDLCMALLFITYFAHALVKVFNCFSFISSTVPRTVEGFKVLNTYMGLLSIPSLFIPNMSTGESLITFRMTSTIEGHWSTCSFHLDKKARLVWITLWHSWLTVPLAHGQYGVVKWWHTRASLVRLFTREVRKFKAWFATNHSIHTKHVTHLAIAVVAASLLAWCYRNVAICTN